MKKSSIKHFITLKNKKYSYTISPIDKKTTIIECKDAHIKQEFLNEDIVDLLNDLPKLILAEQKYKKQHAELIRFRVAPEDKKAIERKAVESGYNSISSFLRDLALGK
ncbi:MAG: hypothetical protein Q8P68_05660 [Candidatus Peregrinibacteria bacterium]|nr:hypothetical protein [Candidatus Peregrinibacteria bacterium]MDZ4245005.1 hypothetical protein [Candidatus Gracilibacteria bacterium]